MVHVNQSPDTYVFSMLWTGTNANDAGGTLAEILPVIGQWLYASLLVSTVDGSSKSLTISWYGSNTVTFNLGTEAINSCEVIFTSTGVWLDVFEDPHNGNICTFNFGVADTQLEILVNGVVFNNTIYDLGPYKVTSQSPYDERGNYTWLQRGGAVPANQPFTGTCGSYPTGTWTATTSVQGGYAYGGGATTDPVSLDTFTGPYGTCPVTCGLASISGAVSNAVLISASEYNSKTDGYGSGTSYVAEETSTFSFDGTFVAIKDNRVPIPSAVIKQVWICDDNGTYTSGSQTTTYLSPPLISLSNRWADMISSVFNHQCHIQNSQQFSIQSTVTYPTAASCLPAFAFSSASHFQRSNGGVYVCSLTGVSVLGTYSARRYNPADKFPVMGSLQFADIQSPVIAADPVSGDAVVAFWTPGLDIYVARSSDQCATWRPVATSGGSGWGYPTWSIGDDGTVLLTTLLPIVSGDFDKAGVYGWWGRHGFDAFISHGFPDIPAEFVDQTGTQILTSGTGMGSIIRLVSGINSYRIFLIPYLGTNVVEYECINSGSRAPSSWRLVQTLSSPASSATLFPRAAAGTDGSTLLTAIQYVTGSSGPLYVYGTYRRSSDTFGPWIQLKDDTGSYIVVDQLTDWGDIQCARSALNPFTMYLVNSGALVEYECTDVAGLSWRKVIP